MQYQFIKSIVESVWMISPNAASLYYPLLRGAFSGMEFSEDVEPAENLSYRVSVNGSSEDSGEDQQVNIVPMRGPIFKHDAMCGPVGTRTLASRLRSADKDPSVIGHIIVTESGGGQAAGVPEMADAIRSLKKPVIAWIDGMSASAAYYINSYCSHIMASRATDEIGCIGTLIQLHGVPRFGKMEDGSIVARIYADGADEKNIEFEKALDGDFKLIKERLLNPHNEQFKSDVMTNRPTVKDDQLTGRTYPASEVIGTLIDSIGTLNDAIQKVVELASLQKKTNQPTNTNNSKKMDELINLNAIASIKDFVLVEGHASFNEEQLQEIEASLELGRQAAERVTQLEAEVQTLTNQVSEQGTNISAKDARIAELEAVIPANEPAEGSLQVVKETDASIDSPVVNSYGAAISACENHLKQYQ